MKNIRLLFCGLFIFSMGILASCGGDDKTTDPPPLEDQLEVGRTQVTFNYDQLTAVTVSVETNVAAGYSIDTVEGDWLQIDQSDKSFTVRPLSVNESFEENRTAIIKVSAGNAEAKEVKVTQYSQSVSGDLMVSPSSVTYEYQEVLSPKRVDVNVDIVGDFQLNNTAPGWITIREYDDYFTVVPAAEWDAYSDRSANVQVFAGDQMKSVLVTQKGSGIVEFEFVNESDVDSQNIPWTGSRNGSLFYVETGQTTYDGEYNIDITYGQGFDEATFRVELDWGKPASGQDPGKRYLKVYVNKNRSSNSRTATVTIIAADDTNKQQTLDFRQDAASTDPIELIAGEQWHIYYDERYEDLVPGYRKNTGAQDYNGSFSYDDVKRQFYFPKDMGTLQNVREIILNAVGNEIYTAHNEEAGFFNYSTTVTQWVVAIKPGMVPADDVLVWDVPNPTQTKWEYDLNAEIPYLRPLPLTINGEEHKLAILTRNSWDGSEWEDYDPDDPEEFRNPNNYCWGLFTDFNFTIIDED